MRNQQKMNQPDCADKCSQVCKLAPVLVDIRINLGISPSRICSDQPAYIANTHAQWVQKHKHIHIPSLSISLCLFLHCFPHKQCVHACRCQCLIRRTAPDVCVCICVGADESSGYLRSPPCVCACVRARSVAWQSHTAVHIELSFHQPANEELSVQLESWQREKWLTFIQPSALTVKPLSLCVSF